MDECRMQRIVGIENSTNQLIAMRNLNAVEISRLLISILSSISIAAGRRSVDSSYYPEC